LFGLAFFSSQCYIIGKSILGSQLENIELSMNENSGFGVVALIWRIQGPFLEPMSHGPLCKIHDGKHFRGGRNSKSAFFDPRYILFISHSAFAWLWLAVSIRIVMRSF
jgi:hypothetical protein